MPPLTPVVKNLIIINVIFFIASGFRPELNEFLALHSPNTGGFLPIQLVTYMFMHGGISHIFFNMFSLFMFGPMLEMQWGPKRFLIFYFVCGFGALAAHYLIWYLTGMSPFILVGASGAIYGVLAGFATTFPNLQLMLIFPPIPMKAKYMVIIFAALELYLGFAANPEDNVAHFAHLGGALFGFILAFYWRRKDGNSTFTRWQ